ncbi:MAG: hypothetical protein KUA35_10640 [Pseudodesulfovibrio sp.]|uniref:hypothetical protein n=1 Tax=Pseudodesulfovibrio TaxID=2035811 RepID=UPI0012FF1D61|nr:MULTISPECIES: hypothetical protein [Pseudodesulfovibrio]MBU4378325.1 hypothetical protein [Pseudomonadota bacterium]MBU4476170.1 hypothetical protein [Pseudomonadota bacterium]MBU4516535.1 hypothetical protein [Pseudomonadota bacterium]MBU4521556.1 hypothetical protein [Pseudomonadota bacterium]MBU4558146.1 hypothetical protein [Pseudomonadota bacterium]
MKDKDTGCQNDQNSFHGSHTPLAAFCWFPKAIPLTGSTKTLNGPISRFPENGSQERADQGPANQLSPLFFKSLHNLHYETTVYNVEIAEQANALTLGIALFVPRPLSLCPENPCGGIFMFTRHDPGHQIRKNASKAVPARPDSSDLWHGCPWTGGAHFVEPLVRSLALACP